MAEQLEKEPSKSSSVTTAVSPEQKKGGAKAGPMGMRVVVRVRPSSSSVCVCEPHVGSTIQTEMQGPTPLEFNAVLGGESTQREAFLCCGLPMLEAALEGNRACLFAYGQTGSGKTFSLLGADGGKNPQKLDGIVPQVQLGTVGVAYARRHRSVGATTCS